MLLSIRIYSSWLKLFKGLGLCRNFQNWTAVFLIPGFVSVFILGSVFATDVYSVLAIVFLYWFVIQLRSPSTRYGSYSLIDAHHAEFHLPLDYLLVRWICAYILHPLSAKKRHELMRHVVKQMITRNRERYLPQLTRIGIQHVTVTSHFYGQENMNDLFIQAQNFAGPINNWMVDGDMQKSTQSLTSVSVRVGPLERLPLIDKMVLWPFICFGANVKDQQRTIDYFFPIADGGSL